MKQLFFFITILSLSLNTIAQGNSQGKGKAKSNGKGKSEVKNNPSYPVITDQPSGNGNGNGNVKVKGNSGQKGWAKNQPKKVQAALLRDYPGAANVVWSKYKGDYTATFNNGIWRSTAVYHANGERRDTRTVITRKDLPGTIWDRIFKRDRVTPTQYTQIERPTTAEKIYRILSGTNSYYYDQNGNKVTYAY